MDGLLLTVINIGYRLIPHLPNATPLAASCLWLGSRKQGLNYLLLPAIWLMASDLFLPTNPIKGYVAIGFLSIFFIGKWGLKKISADRIWISATLGAISFFLISNFGVWAGNFGYAHTWQGLINCYEMGLPFLRNTLVGDWIFSSLIFGAEAVILKNYRIAAKI